MVTYIPHWGQVVDAVVFVYNDKGHDEENNIYLYEYEENASN